MVQVRAARDPLQEGIAVHSTVQTWDAAPASLVQISRNGSQLLVEAPQTVYHSNGSLETSYINVYITVDIPGHMGLEELRINTDTLDVQFYNTTSRIVIGRTVVKSQSGNVGTLGLSPGDSLSSRSTIIKLVNGNIKGGFNVLDLLYLGTKSGMVNVDVTPREASPTDPKPAMFVTVTTSGHINVQYPPLSQGASIPSRIYHTRMATKSGSISGRYLLGRETAFRSESGSISTTLLPSFSGSEVASILTDTASGSTDVSVLSPYGNLPPPMKCLSGSHRSKSGRLSLRYPREWEGELSGHTRSGQVDVRGDHVEIIRQTPHDFLARRGTGLGMLEFNTESGSVDIFVGRENTASGLCSAAFKRVL